MKCATAAVALLVGNAAAKNTPIVKVVGLLTEMQVQVEKDVEADQEAYDKYHCWCTTGRGQKVEAVAIAEKRIAQLEAFLEEAVGTEAQLKTEISSLEADIAEDQEALRTATALRENENAEFHTAEADMKESVGALTEAVAVLQKVQFLQHSKGARAAREIRPMLMQVREKLAGIRHAGFQDVMRRDLWDMEGAIGDAGTSDGEFLAARAGRRMSTLSESAVLSREEPPNEMQGAAAGAKSYSAQSGGVFGMMSEMKDEFVRNLASTQKQEMESLIGYQNLRAAKTAEIDVATKSNEQKTEALADIQNKAAQAKEDLQATKDALGEDQQFLLGLEKNCKSADEDFAVRTKNRNEELQAISQTITILTEDESRDLFSKTLSFVQTASSTDTRQKQVNKAFAHLMRVAKKHHNWILASLAVRVRLDAFEAVKEAMDKMTAEMKAQQKEEAEKKDYCNSNIDTVEDGIATKGTEKEDLEGKKLGLENAVASLAADLEVLKQEVADMHVSLKRAGEDRKAENMVFQQGVADQRGTTVVLKKAEERLKQFYAQAFAQVKKQEPSTEPGAAVAAPPPKPADYSKSGGGAGVLQMLAKIIQEAASAEAELMTSEQNAQHAYEEMVKDSNEAITTDQAAIVDKAKLLEESSADKFETEAALMANGEEMNKLTDTLKSYHVDCDFLLKYFDQRQQARVEEIESIAQAKAILSGADFGAEEV